MIVTKVGSISEWLKNREAFLWVFAVGILTGYLVSRVPEAINYWKARAPIRELAREAEHYGLTYEDVLKSPDFAKGKPVEWFLTHPALNLWFYRGNAGMPVLWEGEPPDMVETGQSGSSHGETIVATVVKHTSQGIVLRPYVVTVKNTTEYRVTH